MTKQTSRQKQPVQAEPVKSETLSKVLDIDNANERSEELAKLDLTDEQKGVAQDAAKKDFLGGDEPDLFEEEEVKPLNNRAQKLIDDLTGKGIGVSYPSDFSKWDASVYERLEKLNK